LLSAASASSTPERAAFALRAPSAALSLVVAAALCGWALLFLHEPGLPLATCLNGTMRLGAVADAALALGIAHSWALHWLAMIGAMMTPLTLSSLRHIELRSYRTRRWRSLLLFLTAYGALWLTLGAALACAALALAAWRAPDALVFPALLLGGLIWQFTPARARVARQRHILPPLAPSGHAADRASLKFGFDHAGRCAMVCTPAMCALMAAPAHELYLEAALALWLLAEANIDPRQRPAMLSAALRQLKIERY
jgi:hypothetical protein